MTLRQEKVTQLIKKLSARFLQRESSGQSLITVTNCNISPDLKKATIFISVLPVKSEEFAIQFVRRKRRELRNFIKQNTKMRVLPFIEVEIDKGEKNRQKIDEILENQ
jgi:ribosome-binding factor A